MPSHLGPSLSFSDSYISIFLLCSYLCCSKSWIIIIKIKRIKKKMIPILFLFLLHSIFIHQSHSSWLLILFISPNKQEVHSFSDKFFSLVFVCTILFKTKRERKKNFILFIYKNFGCNTSTSLWFPFCDYSFSIETVFVRFAWGWWGFVAFLYSFLDSLCSSFPFLYQIPPTLSVNYFMV